MTSDDAAAGLVRVLDAAQGAFLALDSYDGNDRSRAVLAMAEALERSFAQILEANTLDLVVSREMSVADCLCEWLKLTPERLQNTVTILKRLASLPDPLQRVMASAYQFNLAQTYCQLMPLGVVALVYESFPELAAIAAGFCLKTGNSLVLRSCGASSHSTAAICEILREGLLDADLPVDSVSHIPSETSPNVQDLVGSASQLNLVIPYGRPSFVEQISQQCTPPVLKAAMGNCYLYWSSKGDLEMVRQMIIDSHVGHPDPVNAIEKVLVSPGQNPAPLVRLLNNLQAKGFKLRGDAELCEQFPDHLTLAKENEWGKAYLDRTVAFRTTQNLKTAIAWINSHSSGHGDCIATDSYQESRQFSMGVDSALVYVNIPPYFCRNPRHGESLFLGVSSQKGQRRGLIGLEAFMTPKQIVQGESRS
ncbi:glutamate-5-semialdehyde dehydrogenase [Synechocystis sp. CACIAM 05]|uniref:glutamate-5-semialdehyde dehydrogenase n=1 Tax=Synechocystis sp. CACIAM 05 TaxID=1933929 RepID=UPI00138E74FA|nr:gamma-glutamyl-phosphate reductase [Synechocystis sp. CACIAM 05]QHV00833.1 gamma-glutamyl-phosphate reductase [Synechocystis sp. CACIAM 05]